MQISRRAQRRRETFQRRINSLYVIQGGKCFYCACAMQPLGSFDGSAGAKTPLNLATVEHLNSRLNPARAVHNPIVIACNACNTRRARLEEQAIKKIGLKRTEKNSYRNFPAELAETLNNIGQSMRKLKPEASPRGAYGLGLGFSSTSQVGGSCIPAM